MKTIKYEFNDGTISDVEVSDEIYEALKVESRPFEREEKRKQRHGLSLEQFLEDNNYEIEDDSQSPETMTERIDEMLNAKQLKERQLALLREGMKTLTDKQAGTIHKYFFLKMSYEQIAEEEGINKNAVFMRIRYALKKLKEFF